MKPHSAPIHCAVFFSAVALVLVACTSTAPIPATPSKAMVLEVQGEDALGKTPPPGERTMRATVVAVCYNGMVNSDADVWAEATLACPAGKLTLRDDDVLWTSCPLFQPQRANFICVPAKPPEAPAPAQ
jgi:hypothetical protein